MMALQAERGTGPSSRQVSAGVTGNYLLKTETVIQPVGGTTTIPVILCIRPDDMPDSKHESVSRRILRKPRLFTDCRSVQADIIHSLR